MSRILEKFRLTIKLLEDGKSVTLDPADLVAWMEEVERRLGYLEIMAESPKERA